MSGQSASSIALAADGKHIWETPEWAELQAHKDGVIDGTHLRDLLKDGDRCAQMQVEHGPGGDENIVLDFARQQATAETMAKLHALAGKANLAGKIAKMAAGEHINVTEDRAVMHMALRANEGDKYEVDGENVVPAVQEVLGRINAFASRVRAGEHVGATGKQLVDVVSIGIGGSYLGPEFVFEALRCDPVAKAAAAGRRLRFLANVDPVDVARATEGLDPETTLVVVVSKTFTTAETMLNARTMRSWLLEGMAASDAASVVAKHMVAVSANVPGATSFGINADNTFGFWNWVGGRYSVCSAVGVVPLALQYGPAVVAEFLRGARDIDQHFLTAPHDRNVPVLLGLLGIWNRSFLGYPSRALLPYSQALVRFAAHIQQVDMESNGKRVAADGVEVPATVGTGEVDFGEPGTNGQHSFYQLVHQGQVVPADFVGFVEPQHAVDLDGEPVSNHEELMSNFFAQPDALANGRTAEEVTGTAADIVPHKVFPGNRPSSSLLLPRLNAFSCGQLLSIFEHRTAVQGFVWGIASFDQWGVELGKVLAKSVRGALSAARKDGKGEAEIDQRGFNASTSSLLKRFHRAQVGEAAAGGGQA